MEQIRNKELLTVVDIRFHNTVNILTDIVRTKQITRSELAARNQISIMTVKNIIDDLLHNRFLEEHPISASVGRKPMALSLAPQYGHIICINLTSISEISYVVYNLDEQVLCHETIRFPKERVSYRENLLRIIDNICNAAGRLETQLVGVAAFVPSAYYAAEDLVNYDLIPEFKGLHFRQLFQEKFGVNNVMVIHDTYAAAKSEYEKNSVDDSMFYFYCGDGIGGFMIDRGRAVFGSDLIAGEVGKMLLRVGKISMGREETGTGKEEEWIAFEKLAGVPGILERVHLYFPDMGFEDVLKQWEKEPVLHSIMEQALQTISQVLYNLIWMYNPTHIIIDSRYEVYRWLICQSAKDFMEKYSNHSIPFHVEVKEAEYNEYSMMRGCMKLILEKWIESVAVQIGEGELQDEEISG